jgi:hypothetical protein
MLKAMAYLPLVPARRRVSGCVGQHPETSGQLCSEDCDDDDAIRWAAPGGRGHDGPHRSQRDRGRLCERCGRAPRRPHSDDDHIDHHGWPGDARELTRQRFPASAGAGPTSAGPTSAGPTSAGPTSAGPTSAGPTSAGPTSAGPTSARSTSAGPARAEEVPPQPRRHQRVISAAPQRFRFCATRCRSRSAIRLHLTAGAPVRIVIASAYDHGGAGSSPSGLLR